MSKKFGGVNDNFDWYCCKGAVIVGDLNLQSISLRENTTKVHHDESNKVG